MSEREVYDGRYKLDDEVVHVWPASRSAQTSGTAEAVTKLPEVGPAGMMNGVYAPRDHREFLSDRDLGCSGECGRNIQAGERFRFVGKSYRFRRPIRNTCFSEGRYPDVWKAFGYTPKPDYSGKDMPEYFYKYGRHHGGLRADRKGREQ